MCDYFVCAVQVEEWRFVCVYVWSSALDNRWFRKLIFNKNNKAAKVSVLSVILRVVSGRIVAQVQLRIYKYINVKKKSTSI